MGKKLTGSTYVGGQFFEAGSTPDKEYADQITNEKLWAPVEDDESDTEAGTSRTASKTTARKSTSAPSK